jgi:hypothetical protein
MRATVTVKADASTTEEFRLASNSGVLVLVTEPPGVKVLVDGVDWARRWRRRRAWSRRR